MTYIDLLGDRLADHPQAVADMEQLVAWAQATEARWRYADLRSRRKRARRNVCARLRRQGVAIRG